MIFKLLTVAFFVWMSLLALGALVLIGAVAMSLRERHRETAHRSISPVTKLKR